MNVDLGFRFERRNQEILIFHKNILATRLRGTKAREFEADMDAGSFPEQQQLMARLTGNYKRGNERTAKNHPRNRGW